MFWLALYIYRFVFLILRITFQIHFELSYKKITNYYRSIINVRDIEICYFLNNMDSNVFLKMFFDMVEKSLPKGILHSCPYSDELKMFGIYIELEKFKTVLPDGVYRSFVRLYSKTDESIFQFTADTKIWRSSMHSW